MLRVGKPTLGGPKLAESVVSAGICVDVLAGKIDQPRGWGVIHMAPEALEMPVRVGSGLAMGN